MAESTPTTREVRDRFIDGFPIDTWVVARDDVGRDFDRWLAAHDREVAAQALRDFAAAAGQVGWDSPAVLLERLKARADRIEKGDAVIAYIEGTETDRV